MKVVDKEQDRIEKSKTPGGKRAKLLSNVVIVVIVIVWAAYLYLSGHHPMFIGTPHIVTIDGVTVEPGKTTVRELSDAGFSISDFSARKTNISGGQITSGYEETIALSAPVDEKSYYDMLKLVKDGVSYASLSVVNESPSSATLADCKVRSITVYATDEAAMAASVDGVSMDGLTQERLSQVAGEPVQEGSSALSGENKTVTKWDKGHYSMELTMNEDGTVFSFVSKYEK